MLFRSFGGIPKQFRDEFAQASGDVVRMFKLFRPFGDSYDGVLAGALSNLKGISQDRIGQIVNGGKVGSTKRFNATSRAQKGFGGNKNSPMSDVLAFSNFTGKANPNVNASLMQTTLDLVQSEGLTLPRYYDYGVLQGGRQGGAVYIDWARFNSDMANVINLAKSRKENRILDFMNRSGLSRSQVTAYQTTQQGMDDLYGIIDYRQRLSMVSTGSG